MLRSITTQSAEDLFNASKAGDLNEVRRILQRHGAGSSSFVNAASDSVRSCLLIFSNFKRGLVALSIIFRVV
jgi:hypothetical protein